MLVFGLCSVFVIMESLGVGIIEGMSGFVSFDFGLEILVFSISFLVSSEFVRGMRYMVFEISMDNMFLRRSYGSEEIRNGLMSRVFEVYVDKVLFCGISMIEEDLMIFVQYECFVEEVVGVLRSLVNGDSVGLVEEFGLLVQGMIEFDGVGGVEIMG